MTGARSVLIVAHRFFPDTSGGVERRFLDMAHAAIRSGLDVRVLATDAFGAVIGDAPGVAVRRAAWRNGVDPNGFGAVREWQKLLFDSPGQAPDVVWTANPAAAVAARRVFRAAAIIFMPGQWEPIRLGWQIGSFARDIRRWGIAHASTLFARRVVTARAVARSTKTAFASRVEQLWTVGNGRLAARTEVLPRGIATDYWAQASAERRSSPAGRLRVLVAARLIPGKNIEQAIDACMRSRSDVSLTVCGKGPHESFLRSIASKAPRAERVSFLPWTEDLRPTYADHDVFVMCSDREAYGQTAFEALCCGCVLVCRRPAPPRVMIGAVEWLADCEACLMYPTDDASALAAILDELAADRDRRERLSRAATAWASRMSWDSVLGSYLVQPQSLD